MDLLRIGTLGSSRISEPALIEPAASVPEVTVAAVAARDEYRADAFALRHGIPAAYGSYEDLLADPDIDAIYNPLPNSLHGPWTLRAIAAGKHVLCEKPFASNADEAAQVADAAAASGLVVMEAMHYRYHPLTRRLSELVAELGPVQHLQCWTSFAIKDPGDIRYDFDLGGGALMDGGCYAIDCLRLLGEGQGPPAVTGALANPVPPFPGRGPEAAADRSMAVRLAFPGGRPAGSVLVHHTEFSTCTILPSYIIYPYIFINLGLLHQAGGRPVAVVAETDVPAVRGEPEHGGRADTTRAAADQRDPASLLAQPCLLLPRPKHRHHGDARDSNATPVAKINGG